MLGFAAARFAYHTDSGLIGASFIGLIAAAAAFAAFAVVFATLRSPILRMVLALVFAAPAAIAGYALVHGVSHEAIPSAIWRQIFCFIGGAGVGVSALMRLACSKTIVASRESSTEARLSGRLDDALAQGWRERQPLWVRST
jgi:hypothetical protein